MKKKIYTVHVEELTKVWIFSWKNNICCVYINKNISAVEKDKQSWQQEVLTKGARKKLHY